MLQILYKQSQMFNLHMFFHGGNANGLVQCNQTFAAPCAEGQNFKATN